MTALGRRPQSIPIGICFGLAALLGFYLAYGFDKRLKLSSDKDVASALEEAYRKLERLEEAGDNIGSREFRERLRRITGWGEKILDRIGDDPEDFRRARKFLNVYLDGAQQVTDKFARTRGAMPIPLSWRKTSEHCSPIWKRSARSSISIMLDNDLVDLDVQIEVLTTQAETGRRLLIRGSYDDSRPCDGSGTTPYREAIDDGD